MVQSIPEGFNSVSAFLVVKEGQKAIDFYGKAFGATGGACMLGPDGSIMHAEIQIGNSTVMICDENPQWGQESSETIGGSPISLMIYVDDADAAYKQAIDAGCTVVAPLMDAFWGDRFGKVADPFGFQWGIGTHVEDVPEDEMKQRADAWMADMASQGQCEAGDG